MDAVVVKGYTHSSLKSRHTYERSALIEKAINSNPTGKKERKKALSAP